MCVCARLVKSQPTYLLLILCNKVERMMMSTVDLASPSLKLGTWKDVSYIYIYIMLDNYINITKRTKSTTLEKMLVCDSFSLLFSNIMYS